MAKKTTTIVEEEITPKVSPTEEHDKAVLEALTGNIDEALTLEPDKLDEVAPVVEEVTPEPEPTPEPVIDKDTIKEELKAEVTKEVKDLIVSQLEGSKEEKKDAYAEFEKEIWEKEQRTPTYKEALDLIKTQAKEEIKAEMSAEAEQIKQEAEQAKIAQETSQQEIASSLNKDWDEQLDDLVRTGKLPAIKDPNNNEVQIVTGTDGKELERIPVDPGKRARYELFKEMLIESEERVARGAKPVTNIKEVFYERYQSKKQPAGADAPVAGIRKSVSQDDGKGFQYSDIHNVSIEDLLRQS